MKHKRIPVKYIVTIVFVLAVAVLLVFDILWAGTYAVTVESISPDQPVCSGMGPNEVEDITLTVKVTHFGKPVAGHKLIAYATVGGDSAGFFQTSVILTDAEGCAVFVYHTYIESPFVPVKPVDFRIIDEDNSVVFEINAKVEFSVSVKSRSTLTGG